MTNKNKQKRTTEANEAQEQKRQVAKEKAEAAKSVDSPPPGVPEDGFFTRGQLNAVLLVGIGLTKVDTEPVWRQGKY